MDEMNRLKREIDLDRRGFIRKVLSGAIGGSLLLVLPAGARLLAQQVAGADDEPELPVPEKHFAFVVNISNCIGCGACCMADKNEYQVPDGHFRTWVERYLIDDQDNVFVDSPNGGLDGFPAGRDDVTNPLRDTFFVPKLCNMCDNPSCVQVCPVGATFQSQDGFILIDEKRCVGCSYCVQACPYSVRFINPVKKTAEKCTWCYHRVRQDMLPVCVEACPSQARIFGDLGDKESEVYRLLHEPHVISVLKPDMGNKPSLHYLGLRREVT
ncbi:MAG: 4Fe-4S dicluster domain-containing protein [Candidatus Krumholzibacteriota bacterium]